MFLIFKKYFSDKVSPEVRAAANRHLEEKRKQDAQIDEDNEVELNQNLHTEPLKKASRQGIFTLTRKQHRKLLEAVRKADPNWRKIIPSRPVDI